MISSLNGGNLMDPPEPVLSRAEWEYREQVRKVLRRGAFVAYCAGYGCGTALYYGDDYIHCALGSYCRRCWHDVQVDMHLEREAGHDHA